MPNFTSDLCDDIKVLVEPMQKAITNLTKHYTTLSHQVLGDLDPHRYIPVITFITEEVNDILLELIRLVDKERTKILENRNATRRGMDRWQIRMNREECGERIINCNFENIYECVCNCDENLREFQDYVPKENVLHVDGIAMPIDIDRNLWTICRVLSKDGDKKAGEEEAKVLKALDDFWKEVGNMLTSMAVVEEEMRRNFEMRRNQGR